jgi:DNA polymerase III subunit gamma/tau
MISFIQKGEPMQQPYQIIPRRYRPRTFSDVVGQEAIIKTLKNALKFKKSASAYLFCGSQGTGKTTLARILAKALNCHKLSENEEPCNECLSCIEITGGRSLDVLEIDGASNRGIDDIRQINETIGYSSPGKYKIYIIDEVHMLTKEAFNALLKTLEEPPANVKFFFATTEPHKVLPTIVSRCQRFDLKPLSIETIVKKLAWISADMSIAIEESALLLIAALSEGSLRDAESLLDQIACFAETTITEELVASTLGIVSSSLFWALDKAIYEGNTAFAFELSRELFSSGKNLAHFADSLLEHYRTLLLFKLAADPADLAHLSEQKKERYAQSASLYTKQQCLSIIDYLSHHLHELGKTPFKKIDLEMIFLHILQSRNKLSIDVLIRRLIELESKLPKSQEIPLKNPLPEKPQAIQNKEETAQTPPISQNERVRQQSKYDTMMRFAAVELEGSVKKI